jgi:hypothetical protein
MIKKPIQKLVCFEKCAIQIQKIIALASIEPSNASMHLTPEVSSPSEDLICFQKTSRVRGPRFTVNMSQYSQYHVCNAVL